MSNPDHAPVSVHVLTPVPLLFYAIKAALEHPGSAGLKVANELPLNPTVSGQGHMSGTRVVLVKLLTRSGLEDLAQLRTQYPDMPILVLSTDPETALEPSSFEALGIQAFLGPTSRPEELRQTVMRLAQGESTLHTNTDASTCSVPNPGPRPSNPDFDNALTSREKEVLYLVAQGATNNEIATSLFMSNNTVKTHIRNILSKLNAANRTQAALMATDILGLHTDGDAEERKSLEEPVTESGGTNGEVQWNESKWQVRPA